MTSKSMIFLIGTFLVAANVMMAVGKTPARPLPRETATPQKAVPVALPSRVFVVPNFHPASCGWLTNWSAERDYCANSYLDHLDRVGDDPNYEFVLSECNNMIAILNFEPERFAELKRRVKEGRVELVNAFFLESTASLSGGEALVRMGIEGLRWQQAGHGRPAAVSLGHRPLRHARADAPARRRPGARGPDLHPLQSDGQEPCSGRNRPTARAS